MYLYVLKGVYNIYYGLLLVCILNGVYYVYYGLLMSIIIQMSRFRRSLLQPSHTHPLSVQRIAFNLIFLLSTDIQYITCKLNHIFKLCIALENKNRCWINIVDTPRCSEQISHHCKTSSRKPLSSSSSRLWKGGGGTNGDYISSDGSPILTLTLIDNHKCGELYRAPSPTCYISAAQ